MSLAGSVFESKEFGNFKFSSSHIKNVKRNRLN